MNRRDSVARCHIRILAVICAVTLLAGAGCGSKKVVVLHLETRSGSLLYWDRGVVTFTPMEGTSFRKQGEGSWANGAVTYRVDDEGAFIIEMDGQWMQQEAQANMERFGGSFVIEIPLTNVEAKGSFELSAQYLYNDEDDGTGWRPTHEGRLFGPLELPFDPATGDKISLLMQCVDEQREACTPSGWDPDPDTVETTDVPDLPDVADGDDATDVSTDLEVEDMTLEPDALEDVPDVPDVAEEPEDASGDLSADTTTADTPDGSSDVELDVDTG